VCVRATASVETSTRVRQGYMGKYCLHVIDGGAY
jgi:hypothetical protein